MGSFPDESSFRRTSTDRQLNGIREATARAATFYNWRTKYGGMQVSEVKRLKELEDENRRLKKMFAELSLQNEIIKEALTKSDGPLLR